MILVTARIKNFLALNRAERRLLCQTVILQPWIALELRLRGFRRCLARSHCFMGISNKLPIPTADALQQCQTLAKLTNIAARHSFYRSNCLVQSLTLQRLLWRRGIKSQLRIGVRRHQGRFEAHAWVEFTGVPVNDTRNVKEHFVPFEAMPNLYWSRIA